MKPPAPRTTKRRGMTVTGTAELVLEPQVRHFAARLFAVAALGIALLAAAAFVAVRELEVIEPMLAAEGENAARAGVFEVPVGSELRVPIDARTDVLRFVLHAYGPADMPLTPHAATLVVTMHGALSSRTEEIRADLPGLRSRVTPPHAGLGVGDPIPIEVDVHDVGVGELVVRLASVASAEGLLVRAYRREQLGRAEALIRNTALDRAKKDALARWAWELGWDELTAAERGAILSVRWKRIGTLRGNSTELRTATIAVSPPQAREPSPEKEEMLGRVALRGDERIALILHPGARARFFSGESTTMNATFRDSTGSVQTTSSVGQLEAGPFNDVRAVELSAAQDVVVEVRASNAREIEWSGWTDVWRSTRSTPVVVESPDLDRVVRVSLRKPLARQETRSASIDVVVTLTGGGLDAPHKQAFHAVRERSRVDRYQDFDAPEAPSDSVAFFLALSRGSVASVTPTDDGPTDISLAELDETLAPLPMPTRPLDAPPPTVVSETEDAPSAFIARRPSNAHVFEPNGHKVVRTARWFAPAPAPPPPFTVALAHAKHTEVAHVERAGRRYDGITKPFDLERDSRRPLFIPILAAFEEPLTVLVRVESDAPSSRKPALFHRWTRPRTMEVGPRETRATFVIGDDIAAGEKLRLRLTPMLRKPTSAREAQTLVALPWVSTRAAGPRWLAGAFEE